MLKEKIILFFILILSSLTLFLKLGDNPPGMLVDEVSLGYNAYSVLKTARDEWGELLPLTLKSFGDYKPAGYIYLAVPFVKLLGLNPLSVRLPSAIASLVTVVCIYLITSKLTKNRNIGLISAFILAISPWLINMGRMAWEANVSLALFLLGMVFFLRISKIWNIFLSSLFFALSMYVYVGYKMLTPLILFLLLIFYFRNNIFPKRSLKVFILIFLIFCLPLVKEIAVNGGANRFNQVSILNKTGTKMYIDEQRTFCSFQNNKILLKFCYLVWNKPTVVAADIAKNYLANFSFDFLFLKGDGSSFINNPNHGGFYFWLFPFSVIGFLAILMGIKKKEQQILLIWTIVIPIMPAIAGEPNFVRSNMILIPITIFCSIGVWKVTELLNKSKIISHRFSTLLFVGLGLISVIVAMIDYFFVYTKRVDAWESYYPKIYNYLSEVDSNYQSVYVQKINRNPYIYMLFYQSVDPLYSRNNLTRDNDEVTAVGKYKFIDNGFNYVFCRWMEENKPKNILVTNEVNSDLDPLLVVKSFNGVHSFAAIYDMGKSYNYIITNKKSIPSCK